MRETALRLWSDPKFVAKKRETTKRLWQDPTYATKVSNGLRGGHRSLETRRKMSEARRGQPNPFEGKRHSAESRARIGSSGRGKIMSVESRAKISAARKGTLASNETKLKMSKMRQLQWENPDFRERCIAAMHKGMKPRPTLPERKMRDILDRHFPGEWKYVGDFQTWIGGRCPDFLNVNGRKAVIEVFGDYWHSEKHTGTPVDQHVVDRVAHFAKFGFDCKVLWEHEVDNEALVLEKLQ